MRTDALVLRVPGDKSLTHRALMLASLGPGISLIRRPLVGADTESTAAAMRALGCALPELGHDVRIAGLGLRGLQVPDAPLDCGNSGTTTRLLMGILAAQPLAARLVGDESLSSRPMRRVTAPLAQMGARFQEHGAADRLPITVHGAALHGIAYESPHASAQVKSAVLLAALCAGVSASVTEPLLSRDHTERMLRHLGVPVINDALADGRARARIEPVERIATFEFEVPGDFSSAAFMIAAALLRAEREVRIVDVGLNPARTGLLAVLRRMNARVEVENERETCGEPVGDVVVQPSTLIATDVGADEIPSLVDEVPVLAMLAARAEGTTRITGAGELRVKESDRITALVENLRAVGVEAEELADGLVVVGGDAPPSGSVRALHDHRIAMAFGVLGLTAGADIQLDDDRVVGVSYPGFWHDLRTVSTT